VLPAAAHNVPAVAWLRRCSTLTDEENMSATATDSRVLHTTAGDFPLNEYRLRIVGREWTVMYTGAVLTHEDEQRFLHDERSRVPYGVVLWPAAIALAHELAARAGELHGRTALELGAGTGLPGIVAASLGARVVQTERHELAMSVCQRNAQGNDVSGIDYRLVDWAEWTHGDRYDLIIGSDILYAEPMHLHLVRIFRTNLAPGGRILLSDPFRAPSIRLMERLEAEGWGIRIAKWNVGEDGSPRAVGVFDLTPP
jgi:methyltransferase-like protein 23